jgi:hypothetical protein
MIDAHMDEPGGIVRRVTPERTKVYPRDQVFLDVGAKSPEEVKAMSLDSSRAIRWCPTRPSR